jgi:adenylate cyclase
MSEQGASFTLRIRLRCLAYRYVQETARKEQMMAEQVFVARDYELEQLGSFLDRSLDGQGQVCFVTGNAGSGKTALVGEFIRRAQELDPDLLAALGTCNAQTGIGDPYLPFRELLGVLTGDVEGKATEGVIGPENSRRLRAVLARSVQVVIEVGPELVNFLVPGAKLAGALGRALAHRVGWMDKLDELASRRTPDRLLGEGLVDQRHIFEQYSNVVKSLAEAQPLILVVDDLQWADRASIDLLFHLGRSLTESRVLLIGAYRPADVALGRGGQRHPLESVLNEFKRAYGDVWVDLDRAVAIEGQQFIDRLLDAEPNQVGEDFRQGLFLHTDGHPLFTIELLHHMVEEGILVRDELGRWVVGRPVQWEGFPARVEGLIAERIGRLEKKTHQTLAIASVQGEEFIAEVIAQVQAIAPLDMVRRLDRELGARHRLVRSMGVQRLEDASLSLYRFWHGLFQRYLYSSLDDIERAYLHQDVGTALESLYGEQRHQIALQLARHFEVAGVADKAIDYLCQAGQQALALYAPLESVDHLARAVTAAQSAGIPLPANLHRVRGQAYEMLGDFERALSDFEAALAASRRSGDQQQEWQALLDLGELWASRDYDQTGEYYRQALERARGLEASDALAQSLNHIGNWHLNVEEPHRALQYHQEALAVFQKLGHQRGIAETLDLLGMASALGGDLVQSAAYYEQAIARFRGLDHREGLLSGLASMMSGWDYLSATMVTAPGTRSGCATGGEEAVEIAREINHRPGEAYALFSLGLCFGPMGKYGQALHVAEAGMAIAQEIGHGEWLTGANFALGALYLDLLALSQARECLEHALDLAQEVGSLFWIRCATGMLAATCIQQRELSPAESLLKGASEPDAPSETMAQRLVSWAWSEWALASGQPGLALRIVDQLIASTVNLSPGEVVPLLSKLRGQALADLERMDEAEAEFQMALKAAQQQGSLPLQWRLHQSLGDLYQHLDRPEDAGREVLTVRAIVAELAANIPDATLRTHFVQAANSTG